MSTLAATQPAMDPSVVPRPVWLEVDIDDLMAAFLSGDDAWLASLLQSLPVEPSEWEPKLGPPLFEDLLFAYCLERTSRPER